MATNVEITTTYGPVIGSVEGDVRRFLGIPYAAAPFGENRMRRPRPHDGWTTPRPATQPGATVPKSPYPKPFDDLLPEPDIAGEECLNLNIWAPLSGADLPVLVWIHGGAFANGSGIVPQYDGTAFARDGVVCVTINYRLAADGFLYTGDGDTETNLGLRDQIAALAWIRDNIGAFGGDPNRVTIAGESAGAMSVGSLLSSPLATGLFQRAILQSGAGHTAIPRRDAQTVASELAIRLGVEPTRQALASVPIEDLKAAQRSISAEVQKSPDPVKWGAIAANQMPFEPVVDGDVLPVLPIESIASGSASDVDVLIGWNTDEMRLFMVPGGTVDLINDDLLALMVGGFGLPVDDAVAAYTNAGDSPGDVAARVATDWMFRIPAVRLAEAQHANGANIFMYEFAWRTPVRGGVLGAAHALEIPFVFKTVDSVDGDWLAGGSPPQSLSEAMHHAWVAFISDGDPGWDQYDTESRTTMRFDETSEVVSDPYATTRELWDGIR
ncbi:MAG: carboxylesterase/lipase family protein [Microthrixaceae bacterium]|nr:carboxylesterase/lipase family protein [Microthrixaceae bacterium]